MNRVVHAHIKSIMPENPASDDPVFLGGGSRPNARFRELCDLAGIKFKTDVETGEGEPWELKDLRKTCATYCDEHMPESSIEILGHSVGGITYRHYAHRAPLRQPRKRCCPFRGAVFSPWRATPCRSGQRSRFTRAGSHNMRRWRTPGEAGIGHAPILDPRLAAPTIGGRISVRRLACRSLPIILKLRVAATGRRPRFPSGSPEGREATIRRMPKHTPPTGRDWH